MFRSKAASAIVEFLVASLAYLILSLICLLFLLGPFAAWIAVKNFPIAALVLGLLAIGLGVFWFQGVYTWPRYLGLLSAGLGIYACWHAGTVIWQIAAKQ